MNYLVFYSVNSQRKSQFMRVDEIKCVRCFSNPVRIVGTLVTTECVVKTRWQKLKDALVFDLSTEPPTLKSPTTTGVAYFARKHPRFPPFYISLAGHIRESATDKIIMYNP